MEKQNLINGEKLEFGNAKQIQYVKHQSTILKPEDDYEEIEAAEVTCTTSTYVDAHFFCLNEDCKKRISYSTEIEDADEYEALDEIEGEEIECRNCGAKCQSPPP